MKIIYNKNPLKTVVELDENEKLLLWHKIKIQEMDDLLYDAHFSLVELSIPDVNRAKEAVDVNYYMSEAGEKSKLDHRCDMLLEHYVSELSSSHCGDCTCVPSSCLKCHAESILGIDTILNLGKSLAHQIDNAFGKDDEKTLDEAIEYLSNYVPVRSGAWMKHSQEFFDLNIQHWMKENSHALRWLMDYKDKHFK